MSTFMQCLPFAGKPCGSLLFALIFSFAFGISFAVDAHDVDQAQNENLEELRQRHDELQRQLVESNAALEQAKKEASEAQERLRAEKYPPSNKIILGPVTVGGAMRVQYVNGDYTVSSANPDAPQRAGNGGTFELDTFRVNLSLDYGQVIGKLEYRWYNQTNSPGGYNFLHTGWIGYDYQDAGQVQVGVTRVPFGPGPYGVSQSYFFDQHYYLGLADDMDFGIKYLTTSGKWDFAFAYFLGSEGNWNGGSEDSARYSYDPVESTLALNANGDVDFAAPVNGYQEKNQVNARAIYAVNDSNDVGVSLQFGQLDGELAEDGEHWAVSAHMVNRIGNLTLASQITRYAFDINSDNLLGTDELIVMGAYDFAWPVAAEAWIPAASLSYKYDTTGLPWLDYVLPYVEYSSVIKDADGFNDSEMITLGAAWASGGWYIYSDLVYSNGNFFIGNIGDNYSNIIDGVGDFGVNGNDRWNYRFNINLGYYF